MLVDREERDGVQRKAAVCAGSRRGADRCLGRGSLLYFLYTLPSCNFSYSFSFCRQQSCTIAMYYTNIENDILSDISVTVNKHYSCKQYSDSTAVNN